MQFRVFPVNKTKRERVKSWRCPILTWGYVFKKRRLLRKKYMYFKINAGAYLKKTADRRYSCQPQQKLFQLVSLLRFTVSRGTPIWMITLVLAKNKNADREQIYLQFEGAGMNEPETWMNIIYSKWVEPMCWTVGGVYSMASDETGARRADCDVCIYSQWLND